MSPTATDTQVKLTINGTLVSATRGETVLAAARRAGIDIPALCNVEGMAPWGACRLCLIEVEGWPKLQAACTTWVDNGLVVRTETPRVRAKRESYLKMYLSDHDSYCQAPCSTACPTHIDIPAFLERIAQGDLADASAIVADDLPFPGILGRVCPRYCEPECRRGQVDEPIAICALHRAAGDRSPAGLTPGRSTGKRVAVIGAGPAGLCRRLVSHPGRPRRHDLRPQRQARRHAALQHPGVPPARSGARARARTALAGRRALCRRRRPGQRGHPRRPARSRHGRRLCGRGRLARPRSPSRTSRRYLASASPPWRPGWTRRRSCADELPFPGILGRVCPRYCEPVCRRGQVDEPIAICALHRAAGRLCWQPRAALRSARARSDRPARGGGRRRAGGPCGAAWYPDRPRRPRR